MKEESQELRQVKAEFQEWRTTRIRRQAIPKHLWEKAVSLLDKHSLAFISKYLGIDYNHLKRLYFQPQLQEQPYASSSSANISSCLSNLPSAVALVETSNVVCTPTNSNDPITFLEVSPQELSFSHSNVKLNNNCSQPLDNKPFHSQSDEISDPKVKATIEPTCQLVFERKDGVKLLMSLPLDWTNLSLFCSNLLKG